jgi:hypothetical protein
LQLDRFIEEASEGWEEEWEVDVEQVRGSRAQP